MFASAERYPRPNRRDTEARAVYVDRRMLDRERTTIRHAERGAKYAGRAW